MDERHVGFYRDQRVGGHGKLGCTTENVCLNILMRLVKRVDFDMNSGLVPIKTLAL